MFDSKKGRKIHQLAEAARESGKFLKALELTDQASLTYAADKDYLGLAEVQSSRQSTFKHLYRKTHDPNFLILEKHAAEAAVEIAQKSGVPESLAIPYHNLGKYYFEIKDYKKAAEFFSKALDNLKRYPQKRHGRDSVLADIEGHLYAAEYKAGKKGALKKALGSLERLIKTDEPSSYNKNVWISGAYLRIAEMLINDDPKKAGEFLKEAEKIIDSDKRLGLRKSQLKELKKSLVRI